MVKIFRPTVSILMNCFNGGKYLRSAIESVLSQDYSDWELLFWDNQSSDDSKDIFHSYSDKRLRYFLASEHTSLGEARRLVTEYANGEWIAILDVDDYWLPQNLQLKLTKPLDSDVGIVYSRYIVDSKILGLDLYVMPKRLNLPEGMVYPQLTKMNELLF